MIVDILGREVKVGDIVVSTNNSSAWQQIHVVTRLGSTDRVQVNGSGYVMAEYMMICTEQYVIAKGQEAADKLIAEYKEYFEEKPVEKKLPSPKFHVLRFRHYTDKTVKPRYFVVKLQGNIEQCVKQYEGFFSQIDLSEFGQYFSKDCLNKRENWTYAGFEHIKTMKELKALGLGQMLDREIVETDPEYSIIQSFK